MIKTFRRKPGPMIQAFRFSYDDPAWPADSGWIKMRQRADGLWEVWDGWRQWIVVHDGDWIRVDLPDDIHIMSNEYVKKNLVEET